MIKIRCLSNLIFRSCCTTLHAFAFLNKRQQLPGLMAVPVLNVPVKNPIKP